MVSIVFVSCSSKEEAQKIGSTAVEQHKAACAQIIPGMESIYIWENNLEQSQETILILKTTSDRIKELERLVTELHSYDLPSFVGIESSSVSEAYALWVREDTKS